MVSVSQGEVFDVAVDINPESNTYKQWVGITLNASNHLQFYVPPGYAHGLLVLSDTADFQYKCSNFYDPSDEGCVRWNDPEIGIEWPLKTSLDCLRRMLGHPSYHVNNQYRFWMQ